jgi:hypothetical protein
VQLFLSGSNSVLFFDIKEVQFLSLVSAKIYILSNFLFTSDSMQQVFCATWRWAAQDEGTNDQSGGYARDGECIYRASTSTSETTKCCK